MKRIVEFETYPRTDLIDGKFTVVWEGKVSIDLRWVAGAQPHGRESTSIALAGNSRWFTIRIAYSDFMEKWIGDA